MEETVSLIKSCIVSKKGGIKFQDLNREFEKIVGESVPYNRLGFSSLRRMLQEIKEIKVARNEIGQQVLTVTDHKVTHLDKLITKQKDDYFKMTDRRYKRFAPYGGRHNVRQVRHNPKYEDSYYKRKLHDSDRYTTSSKINSSDEEYENHQPVVIKSIYKKQTDVIFEPRVTGQQLIGDDFFLQLAIRCLKQPVWRYGDSLALHCGLCVSGQTIRDCINALHNTECISNRVMIMLGAVDIYNGATGDEIIEDMQELLDILKYKFSLSKSGITICTIPPLANISIYAHYRKAHAFYAFNTWIRQLNYSRINNPNGWTNDAFHVIDFFREFTNEMYTTDYDLFQIGARMVSGCRHPYVLFNKEGCKRAMEILRGEM